MSLKRKHDHSSSRESQGGFESNSDSQDEERHDGQPSHKQRRTNPKSIFLPSLMAGYTVGDEDRMEDYEFGDVSDVDADDVDKGMGERKNRRGQRARRLIWERKYGKKAKHLSSRFPDDSQGQNGEEKNEQGDRVGRQKDVKKGKMKERRVKPSDARRREKRAALLGKTLEDTFHSHSHSESNLKSKQLPTTMRKPSREGTRGGRNQFTPRVWEDSQTVSTKTRTWGGNANKNKGSDGPATSEKDRRKDGSTTVKNDIHPSWDAKRKQADVVASALAGKGGGGKKIVFD